MERNAGVESMLFYRQATKLYILDGLINLTGKVNEQSWI
jgi:hypothetical protein